ncbi:hypothetical protein KR093_010426 [Drosophila rubida]|uniref:Uncharacterized protein n=1 Tax=Drosophila rubida TaxID=30044 RepID=A0AAD4JWR9_9MUSC|nr:hypothetical protein KR093_010426 [Drosophila rubida]
MRQLHRSQKPQMLLSLKPDQPNGQNVLIPTSDQPLASTSPIITMRSHFLDPGHFIQYHIPCHFHHAHTHSQCFIQCLCTHHICSHPKFILQKRKAQRVQFSQMDPIPQSLEKK